MNVLFISNDRSIFDASSATRERMREYAKHIGTLHIISRAQRHHTTETDGSLILHPISGWTPFAFLKLLSEAKRIIHAENIEIVSAQDPFEHGWIAKEAVKGTSAKLHIQIHTDFLSPWFIRGKGFRAMRVPVPFANRLRRTLARSVLPYANGIRVVSKRIADSITDTYGTRVPIPVVIPVSVSAFVPPSVPLPSHDFSFALMCVSRLESEKRIEDILIAVGKLHLSYPSLGLFVVGKGSEERRLKKLAQRLGLATRVIFLGERNDAQGLMQSAQAFIQASAYEGYGRTLIEAALARLPIITTDVGIVGEVFSGYNDVLSAPVADPSALVIHIRGLIEDHAARLALAINAQVKAQEHLKEQGNIPKRIAEDLLQTAQKA